MTRAKLVTDQAVFEQQLRDPQFRAAWEKLSFARAAAQLVVSYRADHKISQRDLAKRLGVSQPAIAQLESGEHTPTIETLAKLAKMLDLEIAIDLAPEGQDPRLLMKRAKDKLIGQLNGSDVRMMVA